MDEVLRAKFLHIYANLPLSERQQVIALINEEPFTWQSAYAEISAQTILGEQILNKIHEIGVF